MEKVGVLSKTALNPEFKVKSVSAEAVKILYIIVSKKLSE